MKAFFTNLLVFLLIALNYVSSQEITKIDFKLQVDYNAQDAVLDLSYVLSSSLNIYNYDKIELLKRPGTLKNTFENLEDYDLIIDIKNDISDSVIGSSRGNDIIEYSALLDYIIKDKNEVLIVRLTNSNYSYFSNPVQIQKTNEVDSNIIFTSETPQEEIIPLNSLYIYDFDAVYSDENVVIEYSIVAATTNGNYKTDEIATIDKETGEFEFFAENTGRYVFQIKASAEVNGETIEVKENFSVIVDNCEHLSKIEVRLVNQDIENVPNAKLVLKTDVKSNSQSKVFIQETNSEGIAIFEVPFGEYILSYNNSYNIIQYFNNTLNEKDAKLIEISECETNTNIKFIIRDNLDTNNVNQIRFVQTPKVWHLGLNEEVNINVKAAFNDSNAVGDIVYKIKNIKQGMTLDAETGEFSWTPNAGGQYDIVFVASLKNDDFIQVEYIWRVKVSYCSENSIIDFTLIDKNESLVSGATATLYKLDEKDNNLNSTDLYYRVRTHQVIKTNDSSNIFEVDKGEYVLSVQHNGEYFWYSNAKNINDSKIIDVECNNNKSINMKIEFNEPTTKRFKGYCLDENNKGTKAMVTFEGEKANTNSPQGGKVYMIQTMDNGFYSLDLPLDYNFRTYAIKENTNKPLYYLKTYDPNQATILNTTVFKLDQLNFVFDKDESNTNTKFVDIKGIVTTSKNHIANYCIIIAYCLDSNNLPIKDKTFSYHTFDGKFNFRIEQGNYVFYAFSQSKILVPGFYNKDGIARFTWEEATIVDLNKNSSDDINIILFELDKIPGLARLNGSVKGSGGDNSLNNANLLLSSKGKSIDYAVTDLGGKFDLVELLDGEYEMTVSKVGYKTYKKNIKLDKNEPLNLDVYLEELSAISSVENDFKVNANKIFPNPSSNYIEIKNNSSVNFNKYEIYNLKGELITFGTYNLGMKVNVSNLNNGKYFIKLMDKDNVMLCPFNVVR